MCTFIGKSNEQILCKLSKSEILKLYSNCHVAMETTKMSDFTCQSKCFISIFFTCQVSVSELQPFSFHDLANDIYWQTAKTVFSHLNCISYVSSLWWDYRHLNHSPILSESSFSFIGVGLFAQGGHDSFLDSLWLTTFLVISENGTSSVGAVQYIHYSVWMKKKNSRMLEAVHQHW